MTIISIFQPKRSIQPNRAHLQEKISMEIHEKKQNSRPSNAKTCGRSLSWFSSNTDVCSHAVRLPIQNNSGSFLHRFGSDAALLFLFYAINCDLIVGAISLVLTTATIFKEPFTNVTNC